MQSTGQGPHRLSRHRCIGRKYQPANRVAVPTYLSPEWWRAHWDDIDKRIYQLVDLSVAKWWQSQRGALVDAMGEVVAKERQKAQEAIRKLTERVIRVEAASNFEERFVKLVGEAMRGSEIPQSLVRIENLQYQLDELKTVAGLDAFRELVERVRELEKTNSFEVHFTNQARA